MPVRPVFRLARAMVFAVVCVTLATAGHGMASHAPVPAPAVVAGLAALVAIAVALAGTERSLATILAGLLLGQFSLHVLFSAAQHGQHLEHGGPSSAHASGGGTMIIVHVGAAAVSAWWLRRGERAVWALAARLADTVVRPARALLARPLPPAPRPRVATMISAPAPLPGEVLRHAVLRRGPPSPSTALV